MGSFMMNFKVIHCQYMIPLIMHMMLLLFMSWCEHPEGLYDLFSIFFTNTIHDYSTGTGVPCASK